MQDSPDAKKPCKGILKTSRSFDRPEASYRKSAKFDEMNVLQTYHPVDKDYGHMKIDEPKTPYNYAEPEADQRIDQLDANLLTEKLRIAASNQTPSFGVDDNISDEEFEETADEKVRRLEFESRRKAHYNEFDAVRLARQLIEEELGDDDEDEVTVSGEGSDLKSNTTDFVPSEECREEETVSKVVETVEEEEEQEKTAGEDQEEEEDTLSDRQMDVDQQIHPSHPCAGRLQQ